MSRPSVDFSHRICSEKNGIIAAEIGVDAGENAWEIYKGFGDGLEMLYLIDPYYPGLERNSLGFPFRDGDDRYEEAVESLTAVVDPLKVSFLRESSMQAAIRMGERDIKFDFVYIDGHHDFDQVMLDLILWWPLMKHGGIIAGHDFRRFASVRLPVEYFFNIKNKPVIAQDEDWWVYVVDNVSIIDRREECAPVSDLQ